MNTNKTKAECGVWLPKSDVQSPESKAQSPEGEIEAEIRLNPSESDLIRPNPTKKIMKRCVARRSRRERRRTERLASTLSPPARGELRIEDGRWKNQEAETRCAQGLDFGLFPMAAGVSFLQPL